jgi:hypothetical protein
MATLCSAHAAPQQVVLRLHRKGVLAMMILTLFRFVLQAWIEARELERSTLKQYPYLVK